MPVIEAASVSLRTLVDGSLRISFDVEPMNAQHAFELFGAPGTRAALAALRNQKLSDEPEPEPSPLEHEPEKPKGGPLAQWIGARCREQPFRGWLSQLAGVQRLMDSTESAEYVRHVCEVESRVEFDHDKVAAERFQALIKGPWTRHCEGVGYRA